MTSVMGEQTPVQNRQFDLSTVAASGAAWLLILASTAVGVTFGYTLGATYSPAIGAIFAIAALGGELAKPFAVLGALNGLRRWDIGKALPCAVLALVCILYSAAADLGLSARIRGDDYATRLAAQQTAEQTRASIQRAEAELAAIPVGRSAPELEPKIAVLKATPGANNCQTINGPVSRRVCAEVADLEAEAARDRRRQELRMAIAEAQKAAGSHYRPVGHADPLAAHMAAYLNALGFQVTADAITPWIALIFPLFMELGSALGLVAAGGVQGGRGTGEQSPPATPGDQRKSPENRDLNTPEHVNTRTDGRHDDSDRPGGSAKAQVVDLLRRNGGRVQTGQRGLAALIGVSTTRVHQLLHELANAGTVRVQVDRSRGSSIELITA